ncbi:hypothetical protein [Lysobacter sp. cf310]|uniref:hypothetical protein n=1 Tax=Lysobacter sp. cf310 TaxID=1761790 RepID=UPI0008E319F9|nr:hypothetical protein [Lysobacter sp. cf310]SFL12516.1 hypothetical protein SAMN04487938_3349 [Lysobacter sp. cf310]
MGIALLAGWAILAVVGLRLLSSPPAQARGAGVAVQNSAAPESPPATAAECDPGVWIDQYREAGEAYARGLLTQPDARARLIAASLLGHYADDTDARIQAAAAYADAVRYGADDPLVRWVEALRCLAASADCDPDAALRRLQQLEPDNAAVWLLGLQARNRDEAAADAVLQRAASARRYRLFDSEYAQETTQLLRRVPGPAIGACAAARMRPETGYAGTQAGAVGFLAQDFVSALPTPVFTQLSALCAQPPPRRRQACIDVLSRMATDADDLASRGLATALLVGSIPDDSDALWRERLRRDRWLALRLSESADRLRAEQPLRLLLEGEIPGFESWLAETGQADAPPPDWLPSDPGSRALILTGRPDSSAAEEYRLAPR